MKKLSLSIFSLMILFIINNAYAYNPEKHYQLSQLAVDLIEKVFADNHDENFKIIAQSSQAEDTDPRRWPDRLFNWHFFSDNYYPQNFFLAGRESPVKFGSQWVSDSVIKRVQNNINEMSKNIFMCELGSKKITNSSISSQKKLFYSELGRALHFIQDASVPAHIVPIYHGPRLIKPKSLVAGIGFIHDPVDSAQIYITETELFEIHQEFQLNMNLANNSTELLETLIKYSIRQTQSALEEFIVDDPNKKNWAYFFTPPKGTDFFGQYAVDSNGKTLFSAQNFTATTLSDDLSHKTELVRPEVVQSFINKRHKQAIYLSAIYLHEQLKNCR